MVQTLACPNCQHRFRLPPDHVGAKIPCPRCEHLMAVPGGAGPEDIMTESPAARRPPRRPVEEIAEVEPDEDALPIKKRGFEPCPRCGAEGAKRVMWTPWGSFYGPALLCHVRCRKCKYAYNGRTGRSNLLWAIIFVTIPALIIAGLLAFIGFVLYRAMF